MIDATGVYDTHLYLGAGRVPAINEKKYKNEIIYHTIDKEDEKLFDGKTALVLGQTYCTAKSINELQKFIKRNENTKLIYVDETSLKPYIGQIKNDIFFKKSQNSAFSQ